MTAIEVPSLLRRVIAREDLTAQEAALVIGAVFDGDISAVQTAGLLVALAAKGERIEEITGAARAMRDRALHVEHTVPMVADIVGTGGDGAHTINVSTMAALVVAAAGVPVAKHGNRAASSACGSADVLEAAGFHCDIAPERSAALLAQIGFTFLFAPRYHPAMRNVGPTRRELGVRTIFNVLGPLTNPARATHMVVGVSREGLLEPMARVLRDLGTQAAAVVHAESGIDEVSGDGLTAVHSFDGDGERTWSIDPAQFGVHATLDALRVHSVDTARDAFLSILGGERSPRADVVALNAGLGLLVCGKAATLREGVDAARAVLASGAALAVFERAKELSHE